LALKHAKPMLKTAYLQPIRGSLQKTIGSYHYGVKSRKKHVEICVNGLWAILGSEVPLKSRAESVMWQNTLIIRPR
jgi:hypothetical protein